MFALRDSRRPSVGRRCPWRFHLTLFLESVEARSPITQLIDPRGQIPRGQIHCLPWRSAVWLIFPLHVYGNVLLSPDIVGLSLGSAKSLLPWSACRLQCYVSVNVILVHQRKFTNDHNNLVIERKKSAPKSFGLFDTSAEHYVWLSGFFVCQKEHL